MLKTWKFWRTFFTTYLALVAGIWGVVQVYSFFREDELKQLFNSNWLIVFYVIPSFIAFSVATLSKKEEEQVETLDQHNRRVMLNHVENFWVKGILEKSLHGAALLELGIKEDPSAINYPWAIKRESTNQTLPAGKPMLEIFEEIGVGRSLLILGAPGSGKTTMLLELARQLIERARKDESEPIPVVFNLSSWTEKQTLAAWLAEQLNTVYYVPKKTAPKWVSENKMLLLLDGLDEVKQESRTKCVEAVNQFRSEHGLTSLVICSRIEEYSAINKKLSLEGAIKLQPLTLKQVNAYFDKFGKSLAGAKQLLKKDKTLRELAETPLMLSIMVLTYKDMKPEELLLVSKNKEDQRKHLFNTYINRMFEHPTRMTYSHFTKQQMLHYLSWLAHKMIQHNQVPFFIERLQPTFLGEKKEYTRYNFAAILGGILGVVLGIVFVIIDRNFIGITFIAQRIILNVLISATIYGIYGVMLGWLFSKSGKFNEQVTYKIEAVDKIYLVWPSSKRLLQILFATGILPFVSLLFGLIFGNEEIIITGLVLGCSLMIFLLTTAIINKRQIDKKVVPGQGIQNSINNSLLVTILLGVITIGIYKVFQKLFSGILDSSFLSDGFVKSMFFAIVVVITGTYGGVTIIKHYILRFILARKDILPWRLLSFLNQSVDLIFLQRVGGGYIFVHRLLMEHFAEMEVEKQ